MKSLKHSISPRFSWKQTKFTKELQPVAVQRKEVVFVVDCSGSMYHDLPHLREDFKNKIATSLNDGDTMSIIYYSSNGDYGFILKNFKYEQSIDSLKMAQNAIGMLKPRNLTGFVDPLNLAVDHCKEAKLQGKAVSLVFMSDGYENENPRQAVLDATKTVAQYVDNGVVVEFGDYANHSLLLDMSATLGGSFVYSKDFAQYSLEAMAAINGQVTSQYRTYSTDAKYVFSASENGVVVYNKNDNGEYNIPENVDTLFEVAESDWVDSVWPIDKNELAELLYPTFYVAVLKGDSVLAWDTLAILGDVELIEKYQNSIGKQKQNSLLSFVKETFQNGSLRYAKGMDRNFVPDENAFCLLSLLNVLGKGDNRLDTAHPDFKYRRIGRRRVQKKFDEQKAMEQVKSATSLEEMQTLLSKVNKDETARFVQTDVLQNKFSDLVYNTSRANISIRCTYGGFVNLPENNHKLPPTIQTYVYRNYTLVKDGTVNIENLPVQLDAYTFEFLKEKGLVSGTYVAGQTYVLDISNLPVINRAMIKGLSVQTFVEDNVLLLGQQAHLKVFKNFMNEVAPKTSEGFLARFGQEGADYLKELGVTEYNGFSPKGEFEAATDFYYAPTLECSLKGKTLPTVAKVVEMMDKNKVTSLGAQLMAEAVTELNGYKASDEFQNAVDKDALLGIYLKNKVSALTKQKRNTEFDVAMTVTSKLLSKTEWVDADKLINGTITLDVKGNTVVAEIKELEQKEEI